MEETFDFHNGRDVLDLFILTVIEDQELLEGPSTVTVREHFRQWCATAPQSKQVPGDAADTKISPGRSPRYHYAIQVDKASLHSIIHDVPAPPEIDTTKRGWVKFIDLAWQPLPSERIHYPLEPLEGVTEMDVGWMKIPYHSIDEYYVTCRNLNHWGVCYRRSPVVTGWPYDG
jgi:hypothetical protein